MRGKRKHTATVEELNAEIFLMVEGAQGMAFISDGEMHGYTPAQFFERMRGRLAWSRESVKIISQFLRKHGEYRSRP